MTSVYYQMLIAFFDRLHLCNDEPHLSYFMRLFQPRRSWGTWSQRPRWCRRRYLALCCPSCQWAAWTKPSGSSTEEKSLWPSTSSRRTKRYLPVASSPFGLVAKTDDSLLPSRTKTVQCSTLVLFFACRWLREWQKRRPAEDCWSTTAWCISPSALCLLEEWVSAHGHSRPHRKGPAVWVPAFSSATTDREKILSGSRVFSGLNVSRTHRSWAQY